MKNIQAIYENKKKIITIHIARQKIKEKSKELRIKEEKRADASLTYNYKI